MTDKFAIIYKLREALEPLPYFYALWLKGADAAGTADEWSDLDFYIDFQDEFEDEAYAAVENALAELSKIDYKYVMRHPHPKLRQRVYHLAETSKFLMIDFCFQLYSRPVDDYVYLEGETIEAAQIIFDKANIIRHKPKNPSDFAGRNKFLLAEAKYYRAQHLRAEKYVLRGQYLEAYSYYNRYVLEPFVDLLRLIYTPAFADYGLIHISQHIPAAKREKLEYFARISSLEEISEKMPQVAQWFDELWEQLDF